MFTSIIRTINNWYQISNQSVNRNPVFWIRAKSRPSPPCLAKLQNAVGYRIKIPADP